MAKGLAQVAKDDGLFAGRYLARGELGRGGMAVVHRVTDQNTQRELALKQLVPPEGEGAAARARALFEREFHTLSELAHPAIVQAYDYGEHAGAPFYTMELLGGHDLHRRAPLPWRDACALLCEICSALSLIHSRRYVYRDLSPRNVRCDEHGKAKLIDLGALAQMGATPPAVCTPAVAAPEVVRLQPLDGRADLYALGATLFFALTGKHAYPARSFAQLGALWRESPRPPSAYVEEIPEALDRLVFELLQLDPQTRPANAAEVAQRLGGLCGMPVNAPDLVSQAYLTTATLVGRDTELRAIRKRAKRVLERKRGASVVLAAESGVGRSRLLDACVLEARVKGLAVLRLGAADVPQEDLGVARAIVERWRELDPDGLVATALPDWSLLSTLLPELRALRPEHGSSTDASAPHPPPARLKSEGLQALKRWLQRATEARPILLAIDDVERLDLESQALLALLAHDIEGSSLMLLTTLTSGSEDGSDPLSLLRRVSRPIELAPLTRDEMRSMLESIFGRVPNLHALHTRLQQVANGNPRDLMHLCQHLLDIGVIRFTAGHWVLPDAIDERCLPGSMLQALEASAADLEPQSRALAWALARFPDQPLGLEECRSLIADMGGEAVIGSLEDLVRIGAVRQQGDAYAIASGGWQAALADVVSASEVAQVQPRLGRVFADRGDGIRAARCLFDAGYEQEGLDVLIDHARCSSDATDQDVDAFVRLLLGLPDDWMAVYDQAAALCEKHARPLRDRFALRTRMLGLASPSNVHIGEELFRHLDSIATAIGLDIYAGLDPDIPAQERMMMALGEAGKRHERTPECERLLPPGEALRSLARAMVATIGNLGNSLDMAAWARFPSMQPVAFLSPVLALMAKLEEGFEARMQGRFEVARAIYIEMLDTMDAPDLQMDATYLHSLRSGVSVVLGILEAGLGLPDYEKRLPVVDRDELHDASGLSIRSVAKLWQGDLRGADEIDRQREVRRVERPHTPAFHGLILLWKMQAHAAAGDLTRARHDLEAIARTASRLPTWKPVLNWAHGEYERLRGDLASAAAYLDAALSDMPAAAHQLWAPAAGTMLAVLHESGKPEEACRLGRDWLDRAEAAQLGVQAAYIRMPLSLALAALGQSDDATRLAERSVRDFADLGIEGLNLGLAYETAARVAAMTGDDEGFERLAGLCKAEYLRHKNRALTAKYQRLRRDHRTAVGAAGLSEAGSVTCMSTSLAELRSELASETSAGARVDRALALLARAANAEGAALYCLSDGRAELRAELGDIALDAPTKAAAHRLLSESLREDVTQTDQTELSDGSSSLTSASSGHHLVLLSHGSGREFAVTGCVVVQTDAPMLHTLPELAGALSRILSEVGDLSAHVVGD